MAEERDEMGNEFPRGMRKLNHQPSDITLRKLILILLHHLSKPVAVVM